MTVSRWERLAPCSGIAFVALAVAGVLVIRQADQNGTDAKILAHYASSGAKAREWVGAALLALSVPFFLWFVALLRSRLAEVEEGTARLANAAFGAAAVFAALVVVGDAIMLSPAVAVAWTPHHRYRVDPNTVRTLLYAGQFAILGGASVGASVVTFASSLVARRTALLPRGLAWTGLVVGPALVLSIPFYGLPVVLFLLWTLATSVVLLRRATQPAADARPALAS